MPMPIEVQTKSLNERSPADCRLNFKLQHHLVVELTGRISFSHILFNRTSHICFLSPPQLAAIVLYLLSLLVE